MIAAPGGSPTRHPGAWAARVGRLLPGVWLGWMSCVAGLSTPSAFAVLAPADAARLVARLLAGEAYASLAFGVLIVLAERLSPAPGMPDATGGARRGAPGAAMLLALGAIFCTVAGYFGVQPMMAAARAGHGALGFATLHLASVAFFGAKLLLVAALAWRAAAGAANRPVSRRPSS